MATSSSWAAARTTPGVTRGTGGGRRTSPHEGIIATQGRVGASPSRQRSSRFRCRPHQQIGVVASQGMGHGVVDGVHGEAELELMQRVVWRSTRHLPRQFDQRLPVHDGISKISGDVYPRGCRQVRVRRGHGSKTGRVHRGCRAARSPVIETVASAYRMGTWTYDGRLTPQWRQYLSPSNTSPPHLWQGDAESIRARDLATIRLVAARLG